MQLFAGKAFDEETRVGLRAGGTTAATAAAGTARSRGRGRIKGEDDGGRNKTALVEFSEDGRGDTGWEGRFMVVAYRTRALFRKRAEYTRPFARLRDETGILARIARRLERSR